jgi:hypothetical protein
VQLRVLAPGESDCTSAAVLEAQVARRLGESGDLERAVPVLVVEFARAPVGSGWIARVRTLLAGEASAAGERRIESRGDHCSDLDDALVIVLATFVGVASPEMATADDASAQREQPEQPAPPEVPAAPSMPARARKESDRTPPRVRVARLAWSLGASAAVETGQLPAWAWGLAAGATGQRRALTLVLGVVAFPKSVQGLDGVATARFAAVLGRVGLCGALLEGRGVRFGPCAGLRAGAMFVRTHGLAHSADTWEPSVDVELGARLVGPLTSRLGFNLAVGAVLPIWRSRFFIVENDGEPRAYHRVQPGLLLELGVIFRLRS